MWKKLLLEIWFFNFKLILNQSEALHIGRLQKYMSCRLIITHHQNMNPSSMSSSQVADNGICLFLCSSSYISASLSFYMYGFEQNECGSNQTHYVILAFLKLLSLEI